MLENKFLEAESSTPISQLTNKYWLQKFKAILQRLEKQALIQK